MIKCCTCFLTKPRERCHIDQGTKEHSRKVFHMPHCLLPLKDQPYAGDAARNQISQKNTARRTGEYMHLRCQVYMSLYWIQIALHIKAIELKWNMKLNYCSISFHIFLSFTAKNGYAWLMLLYDKCEWKYIVLYTMHLTYCKHCLL